MTVTLTIKTNNTAATKCEHRHMYFLDFCHVEKEKANRINWILESTLTSTHTVNNKHICQEKKGQKPQPWTQQSLKNSMMTLQEKEKPVIQQGAYIVIKSHVKKCKHTPPTLTGSVATLPVRATASHSKKTKKTTLNKTPQILRPCRKQHTLILITEKSIFVTKEVKLFICTNLPLQFS